MCKTCKWKENFNTFFRDLTDLSEKTYHVSGHKDATSETRPTPQGSL